MKPSCDIKPVTFMKTQSAELIRLVSEKKTTLIITQNGEAKVAVQDIGTYERDRQALTMLKLLAQGIEAAESDKGVAHDELFDRLEKRLKLPR